MTASSGIGPHTTHDRTDHDGAKPAAALTDGMAGLPGSTDPDMMAKMGPAAEKAAELLRAIGSPHRLMILCLLMERERTVGELCELIGARQSLTSQHLTRLRLDGLVKAERRGHFAYYSLTKTPAADIIAILYRHFCAPA